MERLFTKTCMLIVVALALQMHGNKGCLEKERIALLAIKPFIINSSYFVYEDEVERIRTVESWVDDRVSDCCDWYRVECSTTTGRVMNLSLSGLLYYESIINLDFSLFQPFEQLQILNLSYNSFRGCVDSKGGGLRNLRKLEYLDLRGNSINVSIQELGLANLTNLEFLDLGYNHGMSGSLQHVNLTNLKFLDLSVNRMNGSLQDLGICNFKNLIELDLSGNNFEGHLPPCVNNLTILRALDLSYNQLSGNIPSLNLLKSLQLLSLTDNNFGGLFSVDSLANLSKLEIFQLSTKDSTLQVLETENSPPPSQLKVLFLRKCNLHGIPSFLMYQHSLEFIDLSHNKLVGMFPTWLLQNNTRLQTMYLINNSLSGILQLPNSTLDLLKLRISTNNLKGQLPMNIGVILPRLEHLELSNNSLEGSIPSSMGEMKSLKNLDLSSNHFSGELPKPFVSGCSSLMWLILSNNNFQGEIFPQFMNMSQLWILHLDNNEFGGKIKDGLLKARFLERLDLSSNSFSGRIPDWIGNFSFDSLLLSNNHLEGGVPVQLSNLGHLEILDISENWLSGSMASSFNLSSMDRLYLQKNALNGSIPNAFLRTTDYLKILDLSDNEFSGSIPIQTDEDPKLSVLLLRGNHLEGRIPHELCQFKYLSILDLSDIGNLQQIIAMNLSHNSLSGSIPESFSNLTNIESLDLSHNNLSGQIPPQLTQLNRLGTFNVSFNHLSGPVPDKGQFGTFDERNYGGNPGLYCGPQIKRNCSSSEPTTPPATPSGAGEDQEDESAIHMVSFYWSLFAAYVTTIMAFVLILWLNSDWRKQWFCFIDACIISSYCWILRNVFHRYDNM